jgi:fido (protein-threonine AMPylation protein)
MGIVLLKPKTKQDEKLVWKCLSLLKKGKLVSNKKEKKRFSELIMININKAMNENNKTNEKYLWEIHNQLFERV